MIRLLPLLVLGLLLACERPAPAVETGIDPARVAVQSDRLNAWFEEKYEEELQFSPINLMFQGRKDRNDELDDFREAEEDRQLEWRRQSVIQMERDFDYRFLDDETRMSYDLWKYLYDREVESVRHRSNAYVFEQMQAIQAALPNLLINFHGVDSASDMEAYITRIVGIAMALDQLQVRARKYADGGVRPPRFAYDAVIDQSRKLITGAPFTDEGDSPVWADVKVKVAELETQGVVTEVEANRLRDKARLALMQSLQPAYKRLIAFIESDYNNSAAIATGVGALPNGEAYYDYQLKESTTTGLSAQEIHDIGLSEVDRIRAEMQVIKEEVEFDGDLEEFFEFVRTDKQFFLPNTDEGRAAYIAAAEASLDFIEDRLTDYFGILPKAPLVVKRVESFREQDGAAQHYYPGSPDGSRPGVFYAHLSDMNAMPINQLEAITYHEGLPGHHLQSAISQELVGVPTFRTQVGFTAYSEGWGLYAEALALEMGAYENPYNNFARLTGEMWRAVRLVVDTGIHAKGWTEESAIEYFSANLPVSAEAATSEVRRYFVLPGQATSYKVGMLKIMELRQRAETDLGRQFDIKAFHDVVLGGGALPLLMLERRVSAWVSQTKATMSAQ